MLKGTLVHMDTLHRLSALLCPSLVEGEDAEAPIGAATCFVAVLACYKSDQCRHIASDLDRLWDDLDVHINARLLDSMVL